MASHTNQALKGQLNAKGYRLTPQRQKILGILQALPRGEHLSAEDLHRALSADGERISLSTVYRTLHLMVYMGLLRELELAEGHKHYEINRLNHEHHHHLVCVYCNKTLEFHESSVDNIGGRQAENLGYALLDCQLTLYAVCPDCMMSSKT
ncbi:MAG: Fur family transcriptional regulator [Cyanobacteria bacterium P01_H01_bin.119]